MSVTRVDKLTKAQEAQFQPWVDKWIKIGLKTGKTDWERAEECILRAYDKAKIERPKNIVRVQSPLVGALAASIADRMVKGDAVDGAVRDAVGGAVDGAVGDAVGDAKLSWHYWLGGQLWVGGWWGSPAFVSFLREVCGLKLDKDIEERADIYQGLCESANYIWPNTHFIMICARPAIIMRDNQGRLHSEVGQAIEYPDGWGLYMLGGVHFDKDLWQKITSKKMSADEVMQIQDSDQREIAFSLLGPQQMLDGLKAKLIHTGIKGNRLFECVNFRGTGKTEYCLLMDDASTPRQFIKFVKPEYVEEEKDADYVTARHYQDAQGNSLCYEDYLNITEEA